MSNTHFSRSAASIATALATAGLLAACGGGGGDDSGATTPGQAQGAYQGALTGSTSSAFRMLVLENDQFWAVYGVPAGNTFQVHGFMQGQGAANAGTFTSRDVRDYGSVPPLAGTVNATYVAGTSVKGSVSAGGATIGFNGTTLPVSDFNYNTAASLASVAGSWTLGVLDGSMAAVTIGANGTLAGSAGGCSFTGTLTPRASGKNVFNVTVTFGAAPCALPGVTGTGIGLHYPTNGGTQHQLLIAGVTADRSAGTLMAGVR